MHGKWTVERGSPAEGNGGLASRSVAAGRFDAGPVWVAPSKTRTVRFYYRERSYQGDAVLGEIQIGGNARDLLELQTGFPPTLTGQIIAL